ncbi:hypothetical protein AZ66_27505 [Paenibacillus sp. E194]|uniref:hypothetical protein n=1 Tax=Paenibacillus sp. E194 TaxID=1458845 RepID=UPI0005C8E809|nr:hypothetical protein [Paenibacillus sp. E194]KJB84981.1 hypothetical protein AZ66_27505 [Paenibacillus sp. E194]
MYKKLNTESAMKLAQAHIDKNSFPWTINKTSLSNKTFFNIKGNVWIVEARIHDRGNTVVFIISDENKMIELVLFGEDVLNKISQTKPNLDIKQAIEIAQSYLVKEGISGEIVTPISFYESVMDIRTFAWVIDIKLPPSPFELYGLALFISDESKSIVSIRNL